MDDFVFNSKNYKIMEGNKAYTEDNVLIFNVFVNNISRKVTEEETAIYFSHFGEVQGVRLIDHGKCSRRSGPRVGFVNFVEASSAAKVLQKQVHTLGGSRVRVKPCDSWNQPNAERLGVRLGVPVVYNGSLHDTTSFPIPQLSDDCLEHLCGQLDLSSQICFARMCHRTQNIFKQFSMRVYKKLDIAQLSCLTLWEIRDYFRFAGQHVQNIEGELKMKTRERVAGFIHTYCANLKYLRLYYCYCLGDGALRHLLIGLKNVRELHLNCCYLKDENICLLLQMPRLEIVGLKNNYDLTGKYLNKLVQLKELCLCGCPNVMSIHLIEVFKSLPGLIKLDIMECKLLEAVVFNALLSYCTRLKVLKMSSSNISYECVAQLPNLKVFALHNLSESGSHRQRFFEELVRHKANKLEGLIFEESMGLSVEGVDLIAQLKKLKLLHIEDSNVIDDAALRQFGVLKELKQCFLSFCRKITNDGVLDLLRYCKQLYYLNVDDCDQINIDLIPKAILLLEPRKLEMRRPITMSVCGTLIEKHMLCNIPEYNEDAKKYLLIFEFTYIIKDEMIDQIDNFILCNIRQQTDQNANNFVSDDNHNTDFVDVE